jgi:hypothetical protein
MNELPDERRIRAEIMADPDLPAKMEAHSKKMWELQAKFDNNEDFSYDDQHYYCDCIKWEFVATYPLCEDVFYFKAYMFRNDFDYGSLKPNYTEENERKFQQLVREWDALLKTNDTADAYLNAEKDELEKELKILNRQKGRDTSIDDPEYFNALAWSKFRFLRVRRNFGLDIKADYYSLWLNGEEMLFDFKAFTHILARHFAHGRKTYTATQDHFYSVFDPFHLHLDLEQIFKDIDRTGLYAKDAIQNITIRKKGDLYKVIARAHDYGPFKKMRIVTFYPISKLSELSRLSQDFKEMPVGEDISVFVKG